jgi:hypothetical protein
LVEVETWPFSSSLTVRRMLICASAQEAAVSPIRCGSIFSR